jgi:glutamyl/glutaminyl-tRNA synthetase
MPADAMTPSDAHDCALKKAGSSARDFIRAIKGWDDPRMPTLFGLRRRRYTPGAIRNFCERIGVAKRDSVVDVALLEHSVREDLAKPTCFCVER